MVTGMKRFPWLLPAGMFALLIVIGLTLS